MVRIVENDGKRGPVQERRTRWPAGAQERYPPVGSLEPILERREGVEDVEERSIGKPWLGLAQGSCKRGVRACR